MSNALGAAMHITLQIFSDAFECGWRKITMVCRHAGSTCGGGSAAQRAEQGKFGTSDLARCQRKRCRQAHAAQQHFAARQHGEVSSMLPVLLCRGRMLITNGRMAEPVSHCHSSDAHAGLAQQVVPSRRGDLQSIQLSGQLSLSLRWQIVRRGRLPAPQRLQRHLQVRSACQAFAEPC